jgi:HK97 family phage portal protein
VDLFGLRITRLTEKQLAPVESRGGWWPILREWYQGAWQHNEEPITVDQVITYGAVFSCVTLIASDIAKCRLRLVEQDGNGIWEETESASFSPVLRKPNRYQNRIQFIEQWLISKLLHGNTYVLKQRDNRRVVTALYILDPTRVEVLVAPDGGVYYRLKRDDLSNLPQEQIVVPASEIIHDTMVPLYHPLVGVSPIYACGMAALQGSEIQSKSKKFFGNASRPGGMLSAPGTIPPETATRLKEYFDTNFTGDDVGKVVVGDNGLAFTPFTVNAIDAQLIEQLKWTGENVCTCYHVPPFMVGIVPSPPYANSEPLLQLYYSQCLQTLMVKLETCLDEGMGISQRIDGRQYGTEFDPDDLIWLDTATRTTAAAGGINSSTLSPNEARKKYYGLGPVKGGDSPLSQQQYWPLDQLAERQAPGIPATPAELPDEDTAIPDEDEAELVAAFAGALLKKSITEGLYAA